MFPPGDFIKEELEERGWSQKDLGEIMGRSPKEISDLVLGKRPVSPEIARELSAAFGTSAEVWMGLETSYQLWRHSGVDEAIGQRAALYAFAPITEMIRRHWIEASENVAVLSRRVEQHFEVDSIDQPPSLEYATRKGTDDTSASHLAWLYRAKHIARAVPAERFSRRSFSGGLSALRRLLLSAPEIRHVPRILAEAGIRFVVVEHLPSTRIDGAVLWLDGNSPVIALSLRYDRIDHFWFTLSHELGHIELGHVKPGGSGRLDVDMFANALASSENSAETDADLFAADFLVEQDALEDFIIRTRPLYRKDKVMGFSMLQGVHPGIVVGQLQHREEVPWSSFRPMLEKIRHFVTQSALTDGWGQVPPAMG